MSWRIIALVVAAVVSLSSAYAGNDNVVWEAQGIPSAGVIANGARLVDSAGRLGVTVARNVLTNGGTFATNLSFNAGTLGAHTGYGRLDINNGNNDPTDRFSVTLTFDEPVTNLQFSLLDVDLRAGSGTSDAVEIFYNGNNNATGTPIVAAIGTSVVRDDETYMDGYEGVATAAANTTVGNIALNFGATQVTSVRIVLFTSDDSNTNPFPQFMGISDLTFDLLAELSVGKTNNVDSLVAGTATSYTINVNNAGPNSANGAVLRDSPGSGVQLQDPIACAASGGAVCPAASALTVANLIGTSGIALPTLPAGGQLVFTMGALVSGN
jgi:uncharacterized repeat protein (TIGR01451 family)